jgi:hypothetical protein
MQLHTSTLTVNVTSTGEFHDRHDLDNSFAIFYRNTTVSTRSSHLADVNSSSARLRV